MRRAIKWAQWASGVKTADAWSYVSKSMPQTTSWEPYVTQSTLSALLEQHVPLSYARAQIEQAKNVSFQDKVRLRTAVNSAAVSSNAEHRGSDNLVQMKDLLPALAGAGLGYMGAALAAPIFGFTPMQKRMFGIGGAALGAILNTR